MKDREVTLALVAGAAGKIAEYIKDYDFEKFSTDSKTQSAVIMQLVVIGELSKKIPEEIKEVIDLPWKLMAGFRDFAVHEYFELDLEQVWDTCMRDVPIVKEKLDGLTAK